MTTHSIVCLHNSVDDEDDGDWERTLFRLHHNCTRITYWVSFNAPCISKVCLCVAYCWVSLPNDSRLNVCMLYVSELLRAERQRERAQHCFSCAAGSNCVRIIGQNDDIHYTFWCVAAVFFLVILLCCRLHSLHTFLCKKFVLVEIRILFSVCERHT